jgi:S-disulfanyl-L-cysteine oxidoreductase SoxD
MSTRNARALLVAVALLGVTHASAQQGPGLGQPISAEDLAPWDISIQPDGAGLPAGSGTAARGAQIYSVKCIACHGEKGAGQPNDRLVGGQGTLTQLAQVRTIGSFWPNATTVFDYIRRAMPFQEPESLTNDEVYALTAYLLALNGIVDEDDEMNARSLARVRMPNRDGFIVRYPEGAQR